jgi:signal transduction histidine kinase/ActR/RegA family two-component response regulator
MRKFLFGYLGVRVKILMVLLGTTLFLGLCMIVFAKTIIQQKLFAKIQEKGVVIAKTTASNCINPVLTEKHFEIEMMFRDMLSSEKDIVYIFVLNKDNTVLAHTFAGGFPDALKTAHAVNSLEQYSIKELATDKGTVLDLGVPLLRGEIGVLRMGISEESIRNDVNGIVLQIILFSLLVMLFGAGIAVSFSRVITRPLVRLAKAAETFGSGETTQEVLISSNDEIAALTRIFNAMVVKRSAMEEELRKHRQELMGLVEERTDELKKTNARLIREIAQRERMEAEVVKAQKIESLGVLAGGIAHDFNNLLAVVMGNVSLALLDRGEGSPSRNPLIAADRALLRAQELTQQLLTFSKGGSPVKRAVLIGDLLRESAGFALRGSKVRCDYILPDGLFLIDADEGQISQVIHNIVINADQAMPEGGTITIRCENTVVAEGAVPHVAAGRYVKIEISDSGVGIPGDNLEKIFDPYFTTKQRGSGLGLATTYSIIQKHGGHITVASELLVGTTFTLYLPVSVSAEAAPKPEDAEPARSGTGTVLIMDDEESIRQITGSALARFGYTTVFAENGSRAIELYRQALEEGKPFDAVILDLTIPGGMGGRETLQHLVAMDPAVKAIVSSGYSSDPVMAEYRSYGFAAVVAKPYRIKNLVETVSRVIRLRGPGKAIGSPASEQES